jgi:hypothetical protein
MIICNDFYENPGDIVKYALSLEYMFPYNKHRNIVQDEYVPWRTSVYKPFSKCPFKGSQRLRDRLEMITGERIDLNHWCMDYPVDDQGYPIPPIPKTRVGCWWNCSFHVKHSQKKLGEGVHSHTDRDSWSAVGIDGWAGLLYLNRTVNVRAGLNTWRNRRPEHQFDWMTPAENWELIDVIGNVYNRLILHRGDLPHSGAAGWGDSLENGRLFQTFFFRTAGALRIPAVRTADLGLVQGAPKLRRTLRTPP